MICYGDDVKASPCEIVSLGNALNFTVRFMSFGHGYVARWNGLNTN